MRLQWPPGLRGRGKTFSSTQGHSFAACVWRADLAPGSLLLLLQKGGPFNIGTSSQNLLTVLRRARKERTSGGHTSYGFGQRRGLRNFSLISSLEKLQREDLVMCAQWRPAGRHHHGFFQQAKGTEKPSSESVLALLPTQKLLRRNLWFSIHQLIEATTETNCNVVSSLLFALDQH